MSDPHPKDPPGRFHRSFLRAAPFILILILSRGAFAEEPVVQKEGLFFGVELIFNSIGGEADDVDPFRNADPIVGYDLKAGYTFPVPLSIEGDFAFSGHIHDERFVFFTLSLRYSFLTDRMFNPYLRAGWGAYGLTDRNFIDPATGTEGKFKMTGDGPHIGAGFDYYINRNGSVGVEVNHRFVKYDRLDLPTSVQADGIEGETTSVQLGWKYHF